MTPAEEVMEVLAGRVGTCYCGLSLMSLELNASFRCACGRRFRAESPPSNSWRRYVLMAMRTKTSMWVKTKHGINTPSCQHD